MRIALFDSHPFDRDAFLRANVEFGQDLVFLEPRLSVETCGLAAGCEAVCVFNAPRQCSLPHHTYAKRDFPSVPWLTSLALMLRTLRAACGSLSHCVRLTHRHRLGWL
jgi:hypothetical protein